jgi:uncharacterized protein (DUF2147 family)
MKGLRILLAVLAAGCAGGESLGPASQAWTQPGPSATVYFFRKYKAAGIDATVTTKDRGVDRRLYTGSYFVYQAPPGALLVSVRSGTNQYTDAAFEIAVGKTYYIEVDVGVLDLALRLLDEAEAVSFLKSLGFTPAPGAGSP